MLANTIRPMRTVTIGVAFSKNFIKKNGLNLIIKSLYVVSLLILAYSSRHALLLYDSNMIYQGSIDKDVHQCI